MDHTDVARLIAEQKPDTAAPCPHCGHSVGDSANISVMGNEPRLLATCGGSGLDYTGTGCFNQVAWDPATRKWLAWSPESQTWLA